MATVNGTSGNDELFGFATADTISGFAGNDQMFGDAGNDTLLAGAGDDLVYGNEGNDTITGDDGNDTVSGGLGNDTLTGGFGVDVAIFEGNQNDFSLALNAAGLVTVTDINVANGNEGTDTLSGIETIQFTDRSWKVTSGEFLVNTTTANDQYSPEITTLADGGFIITWSGNGNGDASGVFGQRYSSAGSAIGAEFLINTTTASAQSLSAITALVDGSFVITWSGNGNGDTSSVFGQRYSSTG